MVSLLGISKKWRNKLSKNNMVTTFQFSKLCVVIYQSIFLLFSSTKEFVLHRCHKLSFWSPKLQHVFRFLDTQVFFYHSLSLKQISVPDQGRLAVVNLGNPKIMKHVTRQYPSAFVVHKNSCLVACVDTRKCILRLSFANCNLNTMPLERCVACRTWIYSWPLNPG